MPCGNCLRHKLVPKCVKHCHDFRNSTSYQEQSILLLRRSSFWYRLDTATGTISGTPTVVSSSTPPPSPTNSAGSDTATITIGSTTSHLHVHTPHAFVLTKGTTMTTVILHLAEPSLLGQFRLNFLQDSH